MADSKLYEVEQILGKKVLPNRRVLYLVRWKGFSTDHDTWEPYRNLESCLPLINIYNHTHDDKNTDNQTPGKQSSEAKNNASEKRGGGKGSHKQKTAGKNLANALSKVKNGIHKKEGKRRPITNQIWKAKSLSGFEIKMNKLKKQRHSFHEGKKYGITVSEKFTDVSTGNSPPLPEKESIKCDIAKPAKQQTHKWKLQTSSSDEDISKEISQKIKKPKTVSNEMCEKVDQVSLESTHVVVISDEETIAVDDESGDDDILYSLNVDCDIHVNATKEVGSGEFHVKKKMTKGKRKDGGKSVITEEDQTKAQTNESLKKKESKKKKRMSLLDSKKQSRNWVTKSGLLRSASPPPIFTAVKHLLSNPDSEDPSKPSGNSLPDPVSPEASETYLADVPSTYPVPAEEPLANDQPLSPGSLSYKSLLDSLPAQLHPSHKGGKKVKSDSSSGNDSSAGSVSLVGASFTSTLGREPVERRTSVRSTECAFRYKQIVVKKCFRYTQIWLNTQTVMKNALNPQVIQEIVSALSSAKYDDSHLVLFSSLGNVFCSGTDLHFLVSGDRKIAARQMADAIRELTKTFITFPKPIIAAVSGAAVGLGLSLLALCDVVYASDKASFHLPYSQLSQTPEGCSSFTLPLNLGLASANELLYGGRKITAMEAYQLGLVSQVFWPTLMMQEVIPRAQNMATCSAKALEATKLLVRSHHRTKMELTNETECNLLLERWLSVDCQRAIEAYLSNEKNLSY